MEPVEPADGGFEAEFASRHLEFLDEIGCTGEQHPPSVLDEGKADGGGQMALSAAGRAEQEEVCAFLQPDIAGGESHHLGLGNHRHGIELESVEGLARQEAGLGEMALDAAAVAFGQFVFGDGGQEAGGGPTFLVGLFGELRPYSLDGRQAKFVEKQAEPGGIDGSIGLHAASPVRLEPSKSS